MKNMEIHQFTLRVYAYELDLMGIVHHANYLCYFERARSEMLRKDNYILGDLMEQDILFAVSDAHIRYKAPARLDDLLTITSEIKESGACSFVFEQSIRNQAGKVICEATIQVVCVNSKLRPKRFPKS